MAKVKVNPTTMLYPVPAAMITCSNSKGDNNIITIAWIGTVCSNPPMLSISVRPQRHSFDMIMETKEFVVNLTDEKLVYETDYCGVHSGRNFNKFEELNLTPVKADVVNAPLIDECPVNLECKVKFVENLGSHHIFIAEIVAIHINEELFEDDKVDLTKANLISYVKGNYRKIGEIIDSGGCSIKKNK
ncbi:flavin reductase family protein [Caldisalinibacter kiritimatiensis]|uniref:Flavoredoxin n=1 Tax=Caldisalinibacter kiritimatiensis TaxID=1304284 RepID=R1CXK9_9FIRM|nr:flavin reductase family protein [Caldisalinibacter kiritimatiensis]EOD01349.1 Flavoredoxin [Caldisalinibacter kiritimatiensis]